jgi:hypothetical protein
VIDVESTDTDLVTRLTHQITALTV